MNRFLKLLKVFFCVCLCLVSIQLFAQHEVHVENDSHAFHKSHIALFGGATSNFSHNSTHLSAGLDYEYRWNKSFGTGLIVEYVNVEGGEFIGGFPLFVHVGKGFKITLSPIFINKEHHPEETTHHGEAERITTFAFRTGVGYTFHLGTISLEPALFFDAGESNALVYGLTLGKGF